MLILPTKGRPESLKRFIKAYKSTCATLPIWIILDANDAYRYADIDIPKHWKRVSVPTGTPLGGIFSRLFDKYPDEPYYAMVADDVVPETSGWDVIMAGLCKPNKIVWGWDGIQNEKLPVHPFIGGDLVRKLGWWAAPGLKHWFVDNVWKNLAESLSCGIYLPNVKMTHHHHINGYAAVDRTYREQPNHAADEREYIRFMREEYPGIIKSL